MHYGTVLIMSSFKLTFWLSPLFWPRYATEGSSFDSPLSLSQPPGFPTKTHPLANIISEASPQGLHADLDHTAQAKLTQTKFVFDPGVGKLCDPGSLLIDLTGLLGLHLGFKGGQLSRLVHAQHRAPFFTSRTTPSLKPTAPTICQSRPVTASHPAFLSFLGFKVQKLLCRTRVMVRTRIIGKSLGIKLPTDSTALERIPRRLSCLSQGSDQINAVVCHGLNNGLRRIGCVHHHLLGRLSQISLDSFDRRFQFPRVTGALAHSHPHNHLGLGIGGNLDVVGRAKSPFGLYHVARLRIGGTGPQLFFLSLGLLFRQLLGPSTLKFLQLLERLLKPLLLLTQRSLSRLSHPLTQLLRVWIPHRF